MELWTEPNASWVQKPWEESGRITENFLHDDDDHDEQQQIQSLASDEIEQANRIPFYSFIRSNKKQTIPLQQWTNTRWAQSVANFSANWKDIGNFQRHFEPHEFGILILHRYRFRLYTWIPYFFRIWRQRTRWRGEGEEKNTHIRHKICVLKICLAKVNLECEQWNWISMITVIFAYLGWPYTKCGAYSMCNYQSCYCCARNSAIIFT